MPKIIPNGAKIEFQTFEGSKYYAQVKKSFYALIYYQGSANFFFFFVGQLHKDVPTEEHPSNLTPLLS